MEKCSSNIKINASDVIPEFVNLETNFYCLERKKTLRCREYKDIKCSCTRSNDGENNILCGRECLNRVLLIECSKLCEFGDLCYNKNFQRGCIYDLEIIETPKKGYGLKTNNFISKDSFVIEYVGEVINHREYIIRSKLYHKQNRAHFYCMSLKKKFYIDATQKGGIARFINHSCNANIMTQKWTVNGYPRVGFFALRDIYPEEELSFDYQFQRFGEKPQTCYCNSHNCTGNIGNRIERTVKINNSKILRGSTASEENTENDDDAEQILLNNLVFYEEDDALKFARLMVQVTSTKMRLEMLKMIQKCKFSKLLKSLMKLNGLKLIWTWMMDLNVSKHCYMISEILNTISVFPITTIHQIEDNRLDSGVKRWCGILEEFVKSTEFQNVQLHSNGHQKEHTTIDVNDLDEDKEKINPNTIDAVKQNGTSAKTCTDISEMKNLLGICKATLEQWNYLPRNFKIPKLNNSVTKLPNSNTFPQSCSSSEENNKYCDEEYRQNQSYSDSYESSRHSYTNNDHLNRYRNRDFYDSDIRENRRRRLKDDYNNQCDKIRRTEASSTTYSTNYRHSGSSESSMKYYKSTREKNGLISEKCSKFDTTCNIPDDHQLIQNLDKKSIISTNLEDSLSDSVNKIDHISDQTFPSIHVVPNIDVVLPTKYYYHNFFNNSEDPKTYIDSNSLISNFKDIDVKEMIFQYFSTDNVNTNISSNLEDSPNNHEPIFLNSEKDRPFISAFKPHISSSVIEYLTKYRHPHCKYGRIETLQDFKYLARKLTHGLIKKEISHVGSAENLKFTSNVKSRVKFFISSYMKKFGNIYKKK